MKPILEIQHITKTFRLQHERQAYLTLRESVSGMFRKSSDTSELFHALDDVTFNVNAGESIGIVGRNGAGKSTLLKVLSRISSPTSGKIVVRGRIASLLEVGTGFHPELTGRENIFLNGSILGMLRKEIQSKFDEIVDFSGTEKFLDTPLKHFSSGMQLRLAFAVAAFLEPEILIIDEVLAVGDAEFQKRCMGKMEAVSKSGRTILFVSHNMGAIQTLCEKSVYLQNGKIADIGKTNNIIHHYLHDQPRDGNLVRDLGANKICFLREVKVDRNTQPGSLNITAEISASVNVSAAMDVRLSTVNMEPAGFGSLGTFDPASKISLKPGSNQISFAINTNQLANGLYYLSVDLTEPDKEYYDRADQVLLFEIANNPDIPHGRSMQLDWNFGSAKLELYRTL